MKSGDFARRSLRVLFAVDTPWTEELGLSRVSIEIGRVLSGQGHQVEKFSIDDVRPPVRGKMREIFALPLFQRALRRHIREQGHRFDVIQAEHNTLIFPRSSYRFKGLLIAKSNGLRHFYERYISQVENHLRVKSGMNASLAGGLLRGFSSKLSGGRSGAADRSFSTAEQIHLGNADELVYVRDTLGHGAKCHLVDNGVSEERAEELARSMRTNDRQTSQTIGFVGTWSLRKGKLSLPRVFRQVRAFEPNARLKLLGTLTADDDVIRSFAEEDRAFVTNVERFAPGELPGLLRDVRVGLFLSYVEGHPLGLLELMAAGMPVVAWDAPGVRGTIDVRSPDLLPAGECDAVARRLHELVCSSPSDYARHAQASLDRSTRYRWSATGRTFLDVVMQGLSNVRA